MEYAELRDLKFQDSEQLIQYCKELAQKNGFKLINKDKQCTDRIRLICNQKILNKNTKQTSKTNCNFHLNFNKKNGVYVLSDKSVLIHNHETVNNNTLISETCQDEIIRMKKIGINNFQIIEYIFQKYNVQITSIDISKLIKVNSTAHQSEIQMLENSLTEYDQLYIYQNNDGQISGIFTLMKDEEENYSHFGDFISIDGTNIPNNLNWTTIPISLEDNHRSIVSGGLVFCCSETKEFYVWLFNILFNLFPQIKCVISDEDTSIISALFEFSDIYHILCSKHKIANIYKHINISNYDEIQQKEFEFCLNEFFYSRSSLISNNALNKILKCFPEVRPYFEEYVIPLMDHYVLSKMPNVFTYNHCSTQLSESYNNMIKVALTNRVYHFAEIRNIVNSVFRNKLSRSLQMRRNARKIESKVRNQFAIKTTNEICDLIEIEIQNSENLYFQFDGECYTCFSNNESYHVGFDGCECKFHWHAGIPCRHLIGLYKFTGNWFPTQFVNERFIDDYSFKPRQMIYFKINNEESDSSDSLFEDNSDEEEEDIDNESFIFELQEDLRKNLNQNQEPKTMSLNNYVELLQLSKEIAKAGSINQNNYLSVKKDLQNLINKYSLIKNEDILSQGRRKGRPKTKGHSRFSPIGFQRKK